MSRDVQSNNEDDRASINMNAQTADRRELRAPQPDVNIGTQTSRMQKHICELLVDLQSKPCGDDCMQSASVGQRLPWVLLEVKTVLTQLHRTYRCSATPLISGSVGVRATKTKHRAIARRM